MALRHILLNTAFAKECEWTSFKNFRYPQADRWISRISDNSFTIRYVVSWSRKNTREYVAQRDKGQTEIIAKCDVTRTICHAENEMFQWDEA